MTRKGGRPRGDDVVHGMCYVSAARIGSKGQKGSHSPQAENGAPTWIKEHLELDIGPFGPKKLDVVPLQYILAVALHSTSAEP